MHVKYVTCRSRQAGKASGIPDQVVQQNGDMVRLAGKPGKIEEVRAGRLFDGDLIIPADGEAVARRRIAREGVVIGA